MTSDELLKVIFSASFLFFLFFGVYNLIRVQMFIVKRYEQETDLVNTVFFREYVPYCRYSPNLFSSAIYIFHLTVFMWGWNYWKKKKHFKDISDPTFVTQHFSRKEIRLVKRHVILGTICLMHLAIYLILKFVRPEVLNL